MLNTWTDKVFWFSIDLRRLCQSMILASPRSGTMHLFVKIFVPIVLYLNFWMILLELVRSYLSQGGSKIPIRLNLAFSVVPDPNCCIA
jgi:hypothetical protein